MCLKRDSWSNNWEELGCAEQSPGAGTAPWAAFVVILCRLAHRPLTSQAHDVAADQSCRLPLLFMVGRWQGEA